MPLLSTPLPPTALCPAEPALLPHPAFLAIPPSLGSPSHISEKAPALARQAALRDSTSTGPLAWLVMQLA